MLEKLKKLKVHIGWRSLVLIGVCVALVLIDLLTKIFEERDNWNFIIIPKVLEVEGGHRNPGCAFSFLENAAWGQSFLIAMTFILLAVLIALFIFLPERFIVMKVALSLIIAGAVGNLIDRIAYRQVRDFVGVWMFGGLVYCNFADFWITFGTALAIIDIMFLNEWAIIPLTKKAKAAQAKTNNSSADANAETLTVAEDNAEPEADAEKDNGGADGTENGDNG